MKWLILLAPLIAINPEISKLNNSKEIEEKYKSTCLEASSYRVIAYCNEAFAIKTNRSIKKEYDELMQYLENTEDKERLKESNSKWLQYVEAECSFVNPKKPKGNNDYYIKSNIAACNYQHNINRLKTLEKYNSWRGCNGCAW